MNQTEALLNLSLHSANTKQQTHLSKGQRWLVLELERELDSPLPVKWLEVISKLPVVHLESEGRAAVGYLERLKAEIQKLDSIESIQAAVEYFSELYSLQRENEALRLKVNELIKEWLLADIKRDFKAPLAGLR